MLWGVALGWMNTTYSHHRTALSGWSMRMTGSWMNTAGDFQEWKQLEASNTRIMLENARLRAELESLKEARSGPWRSGSAGVLRSPGWGGSPWMVLNRGGRDGATPGAGVLSMGHAAGLIVDTTAKESLVLTLTHPEAQWSVRLGRSGQAGRLVSVKGSVTQGLVMDVPRAQLVLPGDTVMTTGFDGVFPADVPVGLVSDIVSDEADEFQTVEVSFGANFPRSRHVVWLAQPRNQRLDSLIRVNTAQP